MTDPNKPDQNASDDDWEKAMAEQQGEETGGDDADPWAEALAEQEAAEGGGTGDAGDAPARGRRATAALDY